MADSRRANNALARFISRTTLSARRMVQPGHVRWAQAATRPSRRTRALPAHKELAYRQHAHLLTSNDVVLFLRPGEFDAHEWSTLRAQLSALSANPADASVPPLKLTVLRPGLLSPLVRAAQPRDPKAKKPKHQQQSAQLSDAARQALATLDFSLVNDGSHTCGPIAVVTSPSLHPPTLSKVLALVNKFSKTPSPNQPPPGPKDPPLERLAILSSLVERQAATLERTKEVGKLPSLDTLRAQLIGLLSAPGSRITGVVGARAQEIGRALEGFKLGLEEQGKPKADAEASASARGCLVTLVGTCLFSTDPLPHSACPALSPACSLSPRPAALEPAQSTASTGREHMARPSAPSQSPHRSPPRTTSTSPSTAVPGCPACCPACAPSTSTAESLSVTDESANGLAVVRGAAENGRRREGGLSRPNGRARAKRSQARLAPQKKKRVDAPASTPTQPPSVVNKLKRPPPAPPADGSPAPPPQPPIPPDGSVKTCEAVDRYDEVCGEVVVGGWKGKVPRRWCQMHEDEEKFVRASFWNSVSSLPRLARTHPLPSPTEITSSTSFTELAGWETIARQHMDLAKRAYDSWVFHRTHFFAAGGDLVDRLEGRGEGEGGTDLARGAWEEVRLRGEKAEAVLKLIIRRSHFLVCDAEDALWLLHPQSRCTHATANGYDSSSSQSSCECSHDASYCNHGEDGGLHGSECGCCANSSIVAAEDEDDQSACSCTRTSSASHHHPHHHHQQHHHHSHRHPAHTLHRNHISPPDQAPHNPLRPPGSPTLAPESEEPDPLLALDTLRRTELLELLSLTGSHASFIREGRKSVERVRIVECLFRRLISRDEELLVKAYRGGHDHVLRFFEDPALVTLPALARLHRALQRTSPLELKEAIMDAFRAIAWEESGATETEEGEEGVGMQVLGGWLYRYQLSRSMTPREWSHLYDLCACPGCATKCCQRFTDLALIRRLSVVPHGPHPPPFESWAQPGETDAKKVFKALDVVWCAGKEKDDVRKVRKMTQPGMGIGMGAESVWAARQERNWAFLKLSLTHPHALSILTLLSQFFTLLVRSRLTPSHPLPPFPLPPPAHLWTHRIRTAPTKAALSRPPSPSTSSSSSLAVSAPSPSSHPWRALPNPFNLSHSPAHILAGFDALDSPEKEQDMPPFDGTYEILVLDAPSDSPYAFVEAYIPRPLAAFENFLASVIASACGIKVPGVTVFDEDNSTTNGADSRAVAEKQGMDMPALLQAALEHGAVESFLAGDLVWDFGDVKGVTTPFSSSTGGAGGKRFSGVDLKKVGKNGIVAPPLPTPAAPAANNGANGAVGAAGRKGGAGAKNAKGSAATGAAAADKDKKGKVLDGLRDDSLALRLARSLSTAALLSTLGSMASPTADRSALLTSAVSFLRDPQTASSPLAQRIAFLESKGLTQPEIQIALQQANGAAPGGGGGAPALVPRGAYGAGAGPVGPYGVQMAEYQRDWRDWFIMGVVGGGVGWLAVKLAQKFLVPHLQPPTETDLEASQRALEAKYDEAAELLKTLQESTDAVANSLDEQRREIEKELEEVRQAVKEMREGEKKRDEWAKNVGKQVDEMVKSLPSLLDKQASAQTSSLNDLQTELKSLKSLLIARRPTAPAAPTPSPGSPATTPGLANSTSSSTGGSSLPFNIKPPGLPAWQLKNSSAAANAAGGSSAPATSTAGYSVPDSTAAAAEKDKDPSASGVLVEKPDATEGAKEGEEAGDKGKGKAVEASS
ncbi:hypothetical protein BJY59DRAFT_758150 [Rhodotorula toruloides]